MTLLFYYYPIRRPYFFNQSERAWRSSHSSIRYSIGHPYRTSELSKSHRGERVVWQYGNLRYTLLIFTHPSLSHSLTLSSHIHTSSPLTFTHPILSPSHFTYPCTHFTSYFPHLPFHTLLVPHQHPHNFLPYKPPTQLQHSRTRNIASRIPSFGLPHQEFKV